MIERDDIKGERAPDYIQKILARIGGKTPHGENMYRLVLAQNRFMTIAGNFTDWDPTIPVAERGGMMRVEVPLAKPRRKYAMIKGRKKMIGVERTEQVMVPSDARPLRTVMEVREVHVYPQDMDVTDNTPPVKGWVLERWYPASSFGSRAVWEESKLPDGTPIAGPYPTHGDYMFISGPVDKLPSEGELYNAISFTERNIEKRGGTPESRRKAREDRAMAEFQKKHDKAKEEDRAMLRDRCSPLLSTSLQAGRWRNEMAAKAGIKHHIGN